LAKPLSKRSLLQILPSRVTFALLRKQTQPLTQTLLAKPLLAKKTLRRTTENV